MERRILILILCLFFFIPCVSGQTFHKSIFPQDNYCFDTTMDYGTTLAGSNFGVLTLIRIGAEGNVNWSKKFDFGADEVNPSAIRVTTKGEFLIGGSVKKAGAYSMFFIKTNAAGIVSFSKTFVTDPAVMQSVNDIKPASDNGFILATDAGMIKTGMNGDLEWVRKIDGSRLSSILVEAKGYVFAGRHAQPDSNIFICKTNFSGDIIWSKIYAGPGAEEALSATVTSSGNYAFTGYTATAPSTRSGFVLVTDTAGAIVTSRVFSQTDIIRNAVSSGGSNLVVSGRKLTGENFLTEISLTGEAIWSKSYGTSGAAMGGVRRTVQGYFLLKENSEIIKTDESGDAVCTRPEESLTITDLALSDAGTPVASVSTTITTADFPLAADSLSASSSDVVSPVKVNAGSDVKSCKGSVIDLAGDITGTYVKSYWQGGSNQFTPDSSLLNASYIPSAEEATNGAQITLTLTAEVASCGTVTDSIKLTIETDPTVPDAGADKLACSSTVMDANDPVQGQGYWKIVSGQADIADTLDPKAEVLNITQFPLVLSWTIGNQCGTASDDITINQTTPATVSAGNDTAICQQDTIYLKGSYTVASGAVWTGGSGTFIPDRNTPDAAYIPSAVEGEGGITLVLTLEATNECGTATDDAQIVIDGSPSELSDSEKYACMDTPASPGVTVVLSGWDGQGYWTGGTGTFSPDSTALDALYTPSQQELDNGTAILNFIQPSLYEVCPARTALAVIHYNKPATANATSDINSVCKGAAIALSGDSSNTSGILWEGGQGDFLPDRNAINAEYHASPLEEGTVVTLTLKALGLPGCADATHSLEISVDGDPSVITIDAPPSICTGDPVANLKPASDGLGQDGSFSWMGGNGTFAPGRSALNVTYIPSASEMYTGSVTLSFVQHSIFDICPSKTTPVSIQILPTPIAVAGNSFYICSNEDATLSGYISGSPAGVWIGGNGSFSPSEFDLNTTYHPSEDEILAGSVTLTLSPVSTTCPPIEDYITIFISVCNGVADASLADHVQVTPNPASERVAVSYDGVMPGNSTIRIVSPSGKQVYTSNAEGVLLKDKMIDLSGISKGIYILQISSEDMLISKKLVVE